LLPIHIKSDEVDLRLFTTLMTFGSPQDVTLEELRVEAFFPADGASEEQWHRLMATA
jgi:MmyB-like transcription regulator ligand binding domain